MTRRQGPQRQVALIAAAVFAAIFAALGLGLLAVLVIGLLDGVSGTGPLILAALALGLFLLSARLAALARIRTPAPRQTPADPQALPDSRALPDSQRPAERSPRRAGGGMRARPQPRPTDRTIRP